MRYTSRTMLVSLIIVGVVVGLFFIPEIIRFQRSFVSSPRKVAAARSVSATPTPSKENEGKQKGAPLPSALDEVALEADKVDSKQAAQPAVSREIKKDVDKAQSTGKNESFWSGWSLKVNAKGGQPVSNPTITLKELQSREAQGIFSRGRSEVESFMRDVPNASRPFRKAVDDFLKGVDGVASGATKTLDQDALRIQLIRLENNAVRVMAGSGLDRGKILKWRDIPVVHIIEASNPSSLMVRVEQAFAPRILLRNVRVREPQNDNGNGPPPTFEGEYGIRGSDVDRIVVYSAGVRKQELYPGGADAEGYRTFRLSGEAIGAWTLIAYDKFGARPFMKTYMFLPQARRFSKGPDGSYIVAFKNATSMSTLDRYFSIGTSRAPFREEGISVF